MIPILVFAPARSRGTAFIEAFESPENVILYEPLNPHVGPRSRQKFREAQQRRLGHSLNFDYFKGLQEVQAAAIYPRSLRTLWRQGFVTRRQMNLLGNYLGRLVAHTTERGKRAVFKFEHPVLFHIASSIITPRITVGLSRSSEERLNSYWLQVLKRNNHYFFQRDFSWSLSHPVLKGETWNSLVKGFIKPTDLYNQAFYAVDSLSKAVLDSCDVLIDANSGTVIGESLVDKLSSQPNEAQAELCRARSNFETKIHNQKKTVVKPDTPFYLSRSFRNYVRLFGTVARASMDGMAKAR
jgi:hypothetical protein